MANFLATSLIKNLITFEQIENSKKYKKYVEEVLAVLDSRVYKIEDNKVVVK